jgi:hypothetical protein
VKKGRETENENNICMFKSRNAVFERPQSATAIVLQ